MSKAYKEKSEELRNQIGDLVYEVTQNSATETPFTGIASILQPYGLFYMMNWRKRGMGSTKLYFTIAGNNRHMQYLHLSRNCRWYETFLQKKTGNYCLCPT